MYSKSIGIIGGFGAYATLDFYKNILTAFASDSERYYPHIYMDNDFTMPSRTRALLYGEAYDEVVKMIADSMRKMCCLGADYIVLVCGTAHGFLTDVFKIVPEAKDRVLNIIELLGSYLLSLNCKHALLIAAEGTLKKKVYESIISEKISLHNPGEQYYKEIRSFIEDVKRNRIGIETYDRWVSFLDSFDEKDVVLGCTEFPILVEKMKDYDSNHVLDKYVFHDPLKIVIDELKKIME